LPPSPPPSPLEKLIDSEARVETGEATMSTGAIVGVAVAMLFLVAVLAVVMLLEYRRQKRRAASRQTTSGRTSGTITALLHGLTSTPTSDPKPSKHAQRLLDQQLLDPKAAQVGEAANPPQLAGTLHKRSPTSGFYKKVKVTIEGDTLRYADFKSDKSSVLHGSNVERLEVVNRAQLEFVLKTKMSGPERGRSYSFRVSTGAQFAHWTSGLQQWLGSPSEEPLPAREGNPATSAAPSPAAVRIAIRRI